MKKLSFIFLFLSFVTKIFGQGAVENDVAMYNANKKLVPAKLGVKNVSSTFNPSKTFYVSSNFSSQVPPYFTNIDSAAWYAFSANSSYSSDSITIVLYPGTHKVHHMIGWDSAGVQMGETEHRTPRDYITIIGFGNNSVLQCDSIAGGNFMFSNLYFSGGSHLTLRNFAVNLRGDIYLTSKPWGVEFYDLDHIIIDNVKIYDKTITDHTVSFDRIKLMAHRMT